MFDFEIDKETEHCLTTRSIISLHSIKLIYFIKPKDKLWTGV